MRSSVPWHMATAMLCVASTIAASIGTSACEWLNGGATTSMSCEQEERSSWGSLRRVDREIEFLLSQCRIEGSGSALRSEEHTSELQSLMRISYAVFCLKKTKKTTN